MFRRLKSIHNSYIRMKKRANVFLSQYYDYLEPGVWKSMDGLTTFNKKGYEKFAKKQCKLIKHENSLSGTEKLTNLFFYLFYHFKKKETSVLPQGQVLIANSHSTATKIFDINKSYLITVYNKIETMENYLHNRECWVTSTAGAFSIVPILETSFEHQYIKELLMKKSPFTTEKGFNAIIADYLNCFRIIGDNCEQGTISLEQIKKLKDISEKLNLSQLGNRTLSFFQSEDYRISISHGDLYPLNIILSDEKFYYIDFEIVNKRCFFFDWLKYIVSSNQYGTDLLKLYLSGFYDDAFKKLFELAGVKYCPEDREVYLFAYEMISTNFGEYKPFWDYSTVWKQIKT